MATLGQAARRRCPSRSLDRSRTPSTRPAKCGPSLRPIRSRGETAAPSSRDECRRTMMRACRPTRTRRTWRRPRSISSITSSRRCPCDRRRFRCRSDCVAFSPIGDAPPGFIPVRPITKPRPPRLEASRPNNVEASGNSLANSAPFGLPPPPTENRPQPKRRQVVIPKPLKQVRLLGLEPRTNG